MMANRRELPFYTDVNPVACSLMSADSRSADLVKAQLRNLEIKAQLRILYVHSASWCYVMLECNVSSGVHLAALSGRTGLDPLWFPAS